MSPAECVFIHIGQCGVRTGHSLWELFCLEHGISYDGTLEQGETTDDMELATTTSFFSPTHTSGCLRVTPRSLFVDTEPDSCNEIRCGRYRGLFRQSQLLSGKEDAADNYARGYYNSGKAFLETMTDAIRRLAEQCNGLQGFIIGGATGGGTGSAFTSLLLQHIAVEHGRKSKVTMSILPAHHIFSAVTAPYNNLMALQNLSEYADACFCFDNESLFRICERNFEPERQSYLELNRIIAQVMSSMTASIRFHGPLNASLSDFQTNLIPYPRLHFLTASQAPFASSDLRAYGAAGVTEMSTAELTRAVADPGNMMVHCNPREGRYMACCLAYRGDVYPKDVHESISHMRAGQRFVDWCPTGFKCGITMQPSKALVDRCETSRAYTVDGYGRRHVLSPRFDENKRASMKTDLLGIKNDGATPTALPSTHSAGRSLHELSPSWSASPQRHATLPASPQKQSASLSVSPTRHSPSSPVGYSPSSPTTGRRHYPAIDHLTLYEEEEGDSREEVKDESGERPSPSIRKVPTQQRVVTVPAGYEDPRDRYPVRTADAHTSPITGRSATSSRGREGGERRRDDFPHQVVSIRRSLCMIANTTAIRHTFARLNHKFDLMYSKRAFVHWYVREGMEEGEMAEAREDLAGLEKDYEEAERQTETWDVVAGQVEPLFSEHHHRDRHDRHDFHH